MRNGLIGTVVFLAVVALVACNAGDEASLEGDTSPESDAATEAVQSDEESTDSEPTVPDVEWTDSDAFQTALVDALSAPERDYDYLQTMMSDPFEIVMWYGNYERLSPSEAAEALQNSFLPPTNEITFSPDENVAELLGENPEDYLPIDTTALFSEGWGEEGTDEALLIIGQEEDGNYYWQSILLAYDGFAAGGLSDSETSWQPALAVCNDLQDDVAEALDTSEVELIEEAPFRDYINSTEGTGCTLTVSGTGVEFPDYIDAYFALDAMLTENGWISDPTYMAGGPTGLSLGYRNRGVLLFVVVGWEPSEDAECPTNQPISECELAPEQQIVTIVVAAAE